MSFIITFNKNYIMKKLNFVYVVIVSLIFFSCGESGSTQDVVSVLTERGWWHENNCSQYNQLHFYEDGKGFFTLLRCSEDCSEATSFYWSEEDGVITIEPYVNSVTLTCNATPNYSKTSFVFSIDTKSFQLYGKTWVKY